MLFHAAKETKNGFGSKAALDVKETYTAFEIQKWGKVCRELQNLLTQYH